MKIRWFQAFLILANFTYDIAGLSIIDVAPLLAARRDEAEFAAFTHRHQKRYKGHEEYSKRFGVWKDNLDYVRKWNSDASASNASNRSPCMPASSASLALDSAVASAMAEA